MREIYLTNGGITLVDDDDYEFLTQWRWFRFKDGTKVYARRVTSPQKLMHRLILDATDDQMVDHRDGRGLDNRKENLRLTNRSGNAANSEGHFDRKAAYKGVVQYGSRWAAFCGGGGPRYLGRFDTQEEAARMYDVVAHARFGEFARLNFPEVRP